MYAFKTLTIKGVEGVWERYLQAGHTGGYSSPEGQLEPGSRGGVCEEDEDDGRDVPRLVLHRF